jgi:Domain of unknown function (DUF397)
MIQSHDMRGLTGADLPGVRWRKSRRSNNGGDCVEAAVLGRAQLARDSKNPHGPVLAFSPSEWGKFLGDAKAGAFDLA